MIERPAPGETSFAPGALERRILTVLVGALLGTAICFRLMYLSSMPGISGDEGWWGVQSAAWLSGRPYEARTTSGNPTDLFFLIPVALVHTIAPTSFLALRAIPTLANLLALPLGFWFVRRLYGRTAAWIFSTGLAILPTAIAHSRICQDPSQSVFWTGIVIYLSLLGLAEPRRAWFYLAGALLLFPVVLWTHPTNIFIAPFLVLPFVAATRPLLPASRAGRTVLVIATALLVILGVFVVDLALRHLAGLDDYLDKPWLLASARLTDGAQMFEFAANNARLFNGVTIYHYFSGARPTTWPYDAGVVMLVCAALSGFVLMRARGRSPVDVGLLLACAGTWLGFYAFAGPQALRPHAERWGLCLIVPAMLVFARGLAAWIEWKPRMRWLTIGTLTLAATSLLASFYVNFFREFATTGGRSHLAYVTAPTEPKQQALDHVLAASPGPGRITIVAQQWWLFWPIAYLAAPHSHVSVIRGPASGTEPALVDALGQGRLFFVEFVDTPERAATSDWIRARGLRAASTRVRDAGGRDLLEIQQVTTAR